jgi:hypothetical protein
MVGDIVGYCEIKDGSQGISAVPLTNFYKGRVRVLEFARDGGVLVIDNEGTGIGMFEPEHISRKFECTSMGEYIMPPDLDEIDKMVYVSKVATRKGGWAPILKEMVIQASLFKGVFTDSMLWAKQD